MLIALGAPSPESVVLIVAHGMRALAFGLVIGLGASRSDLPWQMHYGMSPGIRKYL